MRPLAYFGLVVLGLVGLAFVIASPAAAQFRICPQGYLPALTSPTKTLMSGQYLCVGKIVQLSGKNYCLLCGGTSAPQYKGKCVQCKTGWFWSKTFSKCCQGTINIPTPK